jgi:hypothetical protein
MDHLIRSLRELYSGADADERANIHIARIDRALTSRPSLYCRPDPEAVSHMFSRLGIFAGELANELGAGEIKPAEAATALRYLNAASELIKSAGSSGGCPNASSNNVSPLTFVSRAGRTCLDRVEERDIDVLLLEELTSEPGLQRLLRDLVLGHDIDAEFVEVSNSVSTASGGESDLVALYQTSSGSVALLLENKISAHFMPNQAARYHRRGKAGVADGLWDSYITCLIAPQSYLDRDHADHLFQCYVSYEDLLPHFDYNRGNRHGDWRAALVRQAIGGARSSNYVRVADEATTEFFKKYQKVAADEFSALRMPREKDRPATSTWVQFRPEVQLSKRISLWHKARYGTVDIVVSSCRVEELHRAIGHLQEPDMHLEQTGKAAAVRIIVPNIDASASFEAEHEKVLTALRAAARLSSFLKLHQHHFAELE